MAKVSILYHHFPHYRAPVMRALVEVGKHDYSFFGGLTDFSGIDVFTGDDVVVINPITFLGNADTGAMAIADFDEAISSKFDAVIIIGNPNIRGVLYAAIRARFKNLKVAFWAHGWLTSERWWKAKLRNIFFGISNHVLVYGKRAKQIATKTGFDSDKISVIYNSLDWDVQSKEFRNLENVPLGQLKLNLGIEHDRIVFTTISRVTSACQYQLLLEAVASMRTDGYKIDIVMIGDGPCLPELLEYADENHISVRAVGSIYDEATLAKFLMVSDAVVSPGKVGLTAMHSLAYGTPVVTHNNFDFQMPEVESITEGVSGELFEMGSVASLQNALENVLADIRSLNVRRKACRNELLGRYTPEAQVRFIDLAVDRMLDEK